MQIKLKEVLKEEQFNKVKKYMKQDDATLKGLKKILSEVEFKSDKVGLSYLTHYIWNQVKVAKVPLRMETEIVWS